MELRETPFALPVLRVARHPKPVRAKGGGAGGIRTLDRALQPYNGLANRRLQPLGHSSVSADMPDARARRKRQIRAHFSACFEARGKIRAILAADRCGGFPAECGIRVHAGKSLQHCLRMRSFLANLRSD